MYLLFTMFPRILEFATIPLANPVRRSSSSNFMLLEVLRTKNELVKFYLKGYQVIIANYL
jgi:hypothetical protein